MWNEEVVCPRCGTRCAAGRFANHLGKCYGKGRAAARKAGSKNNGMNNGMNNVVSFGAHGMSPQAGLEGGIFDLPEGPLVPSAKGARTKKKARPAKPSKPKGKKAGALSQDPPMGSQDLPFMIGGPGDIFGANDPFGAMSGKETELLDELAMNPVDIGDFQYGTFPYNPMGRRSSVCRQTVEHCAALRVYFLFHDGSRASILTIVDRRCRWCPRRRRRRR